MKPVVLNGAWAAGLYPPKTAGIGHRVVNGKAAVGLNPYVDGVNAVGAVQVLKKLCADHPKFGVVGVGVVVPRVG